MRSVSVGHAIKDVAHEIGNKRRDQLAIGPDIKYLREGLADSTAKQAGAIGEFPLKIESDCPGIGHHTVFVSKDRDFGLAAETDRRFVADSDRMNRKRQSLVMQRQPCPPAKRAVTAIALATEFP